MTQRSLFHEEPDLSSYDLILVNSSGGKDSAASLDFTVEKALEAGVKDRVVVIHADLGDVEWPGTPELVAEHAAHHGLRFLKVSRDGRDLLSEVRHRGMWPDAARRWCTDRFKTAPILRATTSLVEEINHKRLLPWKKPLKKLGLSPVRILSVMGMRAQESAARAKKPAFSRDERASNGKRTVDRWLAIHDWAEAEVWRRHDASGLRRHPAYAMGMSRASCCFCVLASKKDLVRAAQLRPELAERYLRVEQEVRHDLRLGLPMREIVRLAAEEGSRPDNGPA